MDEKLKQLADNVARWRDKGVDEYWVHVGYMGPELHRFGDHDLTFTSGKLYRRWEGKWRIVETGKDFWLFSVPGSFAWARDMLKSVMDQDDIPDDALIIEYDEDYGYVRLLKVAMGQRDGANFTFELKRFGAGTNPSFELPEDNGEVQE